MNIDKAIQILQLNVNDVGKKMPADTLTAIKLGIEASKRYSEERRVGRLTMDKLLPGETKD